MDIKCRKTSCVHNDRYNCMAKQVNISKGSECSTYERGSEMDDVTRDMFESAPEYGNSRHIRDKDLKCECESCLLKELCINRNQRLKSIEGHDWFYVTLICKHKNPNTEIDRFDCNKCKNKSVCKVHVNQTLDSSILLALRRNEINDVR